MVVSAHGLKNDGCYMCSTLVSDQFLKNEINYLHFFFSVSVVVGLKNLERNNL